MTERQVYEAWANSQEAKDFRFKGWDYDRLKNEKAVAATVQSSVQQLKPGLYEVK